MSKSKKSHNMSPSTSEKRESINERWKRAIKKAMALTAIFTTFASVGATIAASQGLHEEPAVSDPNELPNNQTRVDTSVSAGKKDILPGQKTFKLFGVEQETVISHTDSETVTSVEEQPSTRTVEESKIYIAKVQNMIWADQFGINDPSEIQPRGPEAIEVAVDRIKQSLAEGKKIVSIEIMGTASDESDKRDEQNNPGLNVDDKKNENLADMRGKAVKRWFVKQLKHSLGAETASPIEKLITLKDGKEIHDKKMNEAILKMAESLGMEPDDLVMSFNLRENLPANAEDLLEGLRNDRYVIIKIEVSDQVTVEQPSDQIVTTEVIKEIKENGFIIVLVPIPIPPVVLRRKGVITTPSPETNTPRPRRDLPTDDPRRVGYIKDTPIVITQPNTPSGDDGKSSGGSFEARREYTTKRGDKRGGGRVKGGQAHRSGRRSGQGHRGKKAFTR